MSVRLGWYVHHHGGGHLARALAIAPHLGAEIRYFSSLPRPDRLPPGSTWTVLDRDDDTPPGSRPPQDADPDAAGLLHWAPLEHPGHFGRLATIVMSLAERPVDAFVVDVSVEVTLLVRLLGVRTVVVAQPGRRDDAAHELGYRAATTIVAPWPRALMNPAHLSAVAHKTVFTGGISRFEDRASHDGPGSPSPQRAGVLVLGGRGGADVTVAHIQQAAFASGHHPWRTLGAAGESSWSDDPWDELRSAQVVVAWAGQNSIADLAAAGAAAIVVPQERPFAEQRETALALERGRLAVIEPRWPAAHAWPELIERATRLRPDWSLWQVRGAAARAAEAIRATAGERA